MWMTGFTGGARWAGDDGLVGGSDDAVIGWIREIVLNASDPWCLAAFWAGLRGGTPVEWYRAG